MSRAKAGGGAAPARPAPRLRRAYYESRYGQLHLHNAIPAGGGFDELTPLLCLHGTGETGRAFAAVLAALGAERSIYAPDLPGTGESDPAPAATPPAEAALAALEDFLDSMRLRVVDLLAAGTGCEIARRLAAGGRARQVRRVVLLGDAAPGAARPSQPLLALAAGDLGSPQGLTRLAEFLA